MAAKKRFKVNRRVGIAMSVLPPAERAAVRSAIRSQKGFDRLAAVPSKTKKLTVSDPLYTLRVTPQIRLIFKKTDEGIEILDLVERATMDRFAAKRAEGKVGRAKGVQDQVLRLKTQAEETGNSAEK